MARQVTISAPGSASSMLLVIKAGEDATSVVTRTQSGGRAFLGRSVLGKIRIGRSNQRPKFEYAFSGLARLEDVAILNYFLNVKENNPEQQIVLQDEWSRIDAIQLAWHGRSLLMGSTIGVSGQSLSHFLTNVELFSRGEEAIKELGGGLYRYSFFASEV
jgi:hypothetical protein